MRSPLPPTRHQQARLRPSLPQDSARHRPPRRRSPSVRDPQIPIGRAQKNSAIPPRGFLLGRLSSAGPGPRTTVPQKGRRPKPFTEAVIANDCPTQNAFGRSLKAPIPASLFAHDRQHLFERRERSTKNAGVRAAQFKDQKSGACDPKSADGHGNERRGAATRHQPVAEKEKRRPSDDDHDERNGNGSGEREGHLQSRLFD